MKKTFWVLLLGSFLFANNIFSQADTTNFDYSTSTFNFEIEKSKINQVQNTNDTLYNLTCKFVFLDMLKIKKVYIKFKEKNTNGFLLNEVVSMDNITNSNISVSLNAEENTAFFDLGSYIDGKFEIDVKVLDINGNMSHSILKKTK